MAPPYELHNYLESLEAVLRTRYKECVLIPTQANKPGGDPKGKSPLWCHKGVAIQDLWTKWQREGRARCSAGLVLVMRDDLVVLDVDDQRLAEELENRFPEIRETVIQQTRTGCHYFFARTVACNEAKLLDSVRSIVAPSDMTGFAEGDDRKKLPIDIKTRCSTGTGGAISIWPSPNKTWREGHGLHERTPTDLPPMMLRFLTENHVKHGARAQAKQRALADDVADAASSDHSPDAPHAAASVLSASTRLTSASSASETIETSNRAFLQDLVLGVLSADRATGYDTWYKVGMALYNLSTDAAHEEHLQLWIEFSRRTTNRDNMASDAECRAKWETFAETTGNVRQLSMGSLRFWAKQDDPTAYDRAVKRSVQHMVSKCAHGGHVSVASVLHRLFGGVFVCASIKGRVWYRYRGHHWVRDEDGHSLRNVMHTQLVSVILDGAKKHQERAIAASDVGEDELKRKHIDTANLLNKLVIRLEDSGYKKKLQDACADMFYDPDFLNKLDTRVNLIGFTDGVYDLDVMRFRPGCPDDYVSMTVGYAFPNEDVPAVRDELLEFVRSTQESNELGDYVLSLMAYMLVGYKFMEQLYFFCGQSGRNGKGLLMKLMAAVLGDLYYEPNAALLTAIDKATGGANPEVLLLKGRRMVAMSEPSNGDGTTFKAHRLKNWRGNDLIQARTLYTEPITFAPQFGLVVCMNDKPPVDHMDRALASTLRIVDFPFQFVEEPTLPKQRRANANLKIKFTDSLVYRQQFMRVLLETKERLHDTVFGPRKQLKTPDGVLASTREYVDDNNAVGQWLQDAFEETGDDQHYVTADNMLAFYNHGLPPGTKHMNRANFKSAMEFNGHRAVKAGVSRGCMTYFGLRQRHVELHVARAGGS